MLINLLTRAVMRVAVIFLNKREIRKNEKKWLKKFDPD